MPLSKNPFIIHSANYGFDPEFNLFVTKAVELQSARSNRTLNRQEANQKMQDLTAGIYPKLEAYTKHNYGKIP